MTRILALWGAVRGCRVPASDWAAGPAPARPGSPGPGCPLTSMRRAWLGRSAPQGVQLPGPFDTFELVLAPVGELVVPSEQHVANSGGNEDLSEACCLFDPRRDVDSGTGDVTVIAHLELASVDPGTHAKVDGAELGYHVGGRAHRL